MNHSDFINVELVRLQYRVDACLERNGGNEHHAVTSSGVGISYGFAKSICHTLRDEKKEIDALRAALIEFNKLCPDLCQLLDGWHADIAWTEWDQKVRNDLTSVGAKAREALTDATPKEGI